MELKVQQFFALSRHQRIHFAPAEAALMSARESKRRKHRLLGVALSATSYDCYWAGVLLSLLAKIADSLGVGVASKSCFRALATEKDRGNGKCVLKQVEPQKIIL